MSIAKITSSISPLEEVAKINQMIDRTCITNHNLTDTFSQGEWVKGVVNSKAGIYTSLVDNNTGNALTDTTKWKEVKMGSEVWYDNSTATLYIGIEQPADTDSDSDTDTDDD